MTTPAQKKANAAYKKKNYKRIPLNVRFKDYEKIKAAAKSEDLPVNTFIKKAIAEHMHIEPF